MSADRPPAPPGYLWRILHDAVSPVAGRGAVRRLLGATALPGDGPRPAAALPPDFRYAEAHLGDAPAVFVTPSDDREALVRPAPPRAPATASAATAVPPPSILARPGDLRPGPPPLVAPPAALRALPDAPVLTPPRATKGAIPTLESGDTPTMSQAFAPSAPPAHAGAASPATGPIATLAPTARRPLPAPIPVIDIPDDRGRAGRTAPGPVARPDTPVDVTPQREATPAPARQDTPPPPPTPGGERAWPTTPVQPTAPAQRALAPDAPPPLAPFARTSDPPAPPDRRPPGTESAPPPARRRAAPDRLRPPRQEAHEPSVQPLAPRPRTTWAAPPPFPVARGGITGHPSTDAAAPLVAAPPPAPAPPPIVVQAAPPRDAAPRAFWERRHLGRLRLRGMR